MSFISSCRVDGTPESQLPNTREVIVTPKRFYFDVGNNNRGVYLRVTEVRLCAVLLIVSIVYLHFVVHVVLMELTCAAALTCSQSVLAHFLWWPAHLL